MVVAVCLSETAASLTRLHGVASQTAAAATYSYVRIAVVLFGNECDNQMQWQCSAPVFE